MGLWESSCVAHTVWVVFGWPRSCSNFVVYWLYLTASSGGIDPTTGEWWHWRETTLVLHSCYSGGHGNPTTPREKVYLHLWLCMIKICDKRKEILCVWHSIKCYRCTILRIEMNYRKNNAISVSVNTIISWAPGWFWRKWWAIVSRTSRSSTHKFGISIYLRTPSPTQKYLIPRSWKARQNERSRKRKRH